MGYETKLIIGNHYDFTPENVVADIIVLDLFCAGYSTETGRVLERYRKDTTTPTYSIYDATQDSGHTDTDLYGEKLREVPLEPLLDALERDNAHEPYRRFALAIAVLRSFKTDPGWQALDKLKIIQYGH